MDSTSLLSFFERKGVLFVHKYDRNSQPVAFETIEEAAIESEAEEVVITCDEDKIIPPLEVPDEEVEKDKRAAREPIVEDTDLFDQTMHWKLVVSEEGLMSTKSLIEKNYPDLVLKSYSVEYVAKEAISLSDEDLETFIKFCQDLSEVEEFENVYSNVNS